MNIIYKDIPGMENEYQATSDGQIWSLKSKKFLKQQLKGPQGKEYYYVCICQNNIKKNYRVNRLIAMAFIPNPDNLTCVNHIDNNKLNNSFDNLEWCSYEYNNSYNDRIMRSVETRKQNNNCTNPIMCDKITHEPIKEFDTTRDAIRYLGLSKNADSNISAVLNGRKKSAYGYFWKYKNSNS